MLTVLKKEVRKENKRIKFIHKIRKVVEWHNRVFVLLEIPPEDSFLNNLYCFSSDLKLLWRSSPLEEKYTNRKLYPYEDFYIVDNRLFCYDFIGRRYEIDVTSGEVGEYRLFR